MPYYDDPAARPRQAPTAYVGAARAVGPRDRPPIGLWRTWLLLSLVLLGVSASACDLLTGSEATGIIIDSGGSLELPWGDTVALTVRDANGAVVGSDRVEWSSDHPSIATVSPGGLVAGEGIGSTAIRAELNGARTSIRVQVVVEGAEDIMHIRVTGDLDEEYLVYPGSGPYSFAVGLQALFPDRPSWAFGYLLGETYSLADDRVGGVVFALPGELAVGVHRLATATTEQLAQASLIRLDGPIGYLFRETSDRSFYVYPLSEGTLEVTALDELTISFAAGSIRGAASFSADEYVETYDAMTGRYEPKPTGRSVDVDVVFHIPAGVYYGGYMDLAAVGGTYADEEYVEGWTDGVEDPVYGTVLDLRARDSSGSPVSLELVVDAAAVGTHHVGTGVAARWSQRTSTGWLEASGGSGTVTFAEYVQPTADAWGLARGTLDIGLSVAETSAQEVDEPVDVAGSFAVPIAPIPGNAASGAAPDQRALPALLYPWGRQVRAPTRLPAWPAAKEQAVLP